MEAGIIKTKFPRLSNCLGKLNVPKVKLEAELHVISMSRRVPVPLLFQVKEELSRMEQMQIISQVDESIEWCTGIVKFPKSNGKVRIYVPNHSDIY